jgi:hypothetical protein
VKGQGWTQWAALEANATLDGNGWPKPGIALGGTMAWAAWQHDVEGAGEVWASTASLIP